MVKTVMGNFASVEYRGRVVVKLAAHEKLARELEARGVAPEEIERLIAGDCALPDGTRKAERIVAIAYILVDNRRKGIEAHNARIAKKENKMSELGIHFVTQIGRPFELKDGIKVASATYYRIRRREYNNGRRVNAQLILEYIEDQLAGKRTTKIEGEITRSGYSIRETLRAEAEERESRYASETDYIVAQVYAVEELKRLRRAMGDRLVAKLDSIFMAARARNVDEFMKNNNVSMLFKNIRRKYGAKYMVGASYTDMIAIFFNNWNEASEDEGYSYNIAI